MRSLGANPRKEASKIEAGFPELAADLHLPQPLATDSSFSSVLRISSGEPSNACTQKVYLTSVHDLLTCQCPWGGALEHRGLLS